MRDTSKTLLPMLLTKGQVAALLGVSERTVFNLAKRGEIVSRKLGAAVRYTRQSVERVAGIESSEVNR